MGSGTGTSASSEKSYQLIYYGDCYTPEEASSHTSLAGFTADWAEIVEIYPARNSTIRFDVGTTLVRYLSDRPDPIQFRLGGLLSTKYIITPGNVRRITSSITLTGSSVATECPDTGYSAVTVNSPDRTTLGYNESDISRKDLWSISGHNSSRCHRIQAAKLPPAADRR